MINGEFNTTILSEQDLLAIYAPISDCNFPSSHVISSHSFLSANGYRVLDLIGANSSSIVLRCSSVESTSESLREFAVKVQICRNEAKIAENLFELQNPLLSTNVLPHSLKLFSLLHDVFHDTIFVIMELCLCGDIQSMQRTHPYIARETLLSLALQMCQSVDDLHSVNMIHGDINPSNFLLASPNRVKLAVHSSSKFLLNRSTSISVTDPFSMHYASKRQLQGLPANQQDDQYSLAAVLLDLCRLEFNPIEVYDRLTCLDYGSIMQLLAGNQREDIKDLQEIAVLLLANMISIPEAIHRILQSIETSDVNEPVISTTLSTIDDSQALMTNEVQQLQQQLKKSDEDEYKNPEQQQSQSEQKQSETNSEEANPSSVLSRLLALYQGFKQSFNRALQSLFRFTLTFILTMYPELLDDHLAKQANRKIAQTDDTYTQTSPLRNRTNHLDILDSVAPGAASRSVSHSLSTSSLSFSSLTLTSHRTNGQDSQVPSARNPSMPYECELTTNYLNTEEEEEDAKNRVNLSDCCSDTSFDEGSQAGDAINGNTHAHSLPLQQSQAPSSKKPAIHIPRLVIPSLQLEKQEQQLDLPSDYEDLQKQNGHRHKNISLTERSNIADDDTNAKKVDIIVFPNGYYIGDVKQKQPHGEGKMYFHKGNRYEGSFIDGLYEGKGVYYYAIGNKYVGQWSNNLREGRGLFKWANGTTYFGEYKKNMKTGMGTLKYKDGEKYSGMFKDNSFHGEGTYYFTDGTKFQGVFENGEKLDGGHFVLPDGSISTDPNFRRINLHRKVSCEK